MDRDKEFTPTYENYLGFHVDKAYVYKITDFVKQCDKFSVKHLKVRIIVNLLEL
jgi:hypothetical protein